MIPPRDIVVVGAGIVGCAIAYELARRGASVEVVDTRSPGMGATQASAGVLAPYLEAEDGTALLELATRSLDYVTAQEALGARPARILARTILPNVAPSIIVVASLQFSQFIVAEAAISFLGFGVQPPTPAWGSMLSESRDFLYIAWWLAAFPGAALALTALGVNLVGDWLRDTLDPKLRL